MSNHLYLECWSHESGKLMSDCVGHNLSALPDVRKALWKAKQFHEMSQMMTDLGVPHPDFLVSEERELFNFIVDHHLCDIRIIDEYGKYHDEKSEASPSRPRYNIAVGQKLMLMKSGRVGLIPVRVTSLEGRNGGAVVMGIEDW